MINFNNIFKQIPNKLADKINTSLFIVSTSIILFLFIICILSYLGFILHFPIHKTYFFVSSVSSILFLFFLNKQYMLSRKEILIETILLFSIFFISAILASLFLDNSWDGRAYHQETIILLTNGWNPVWAKPHFDLFNPIIWVEHYPKCAEILSANFSVLFNNIESGKIINYLFASSTFLLAFFTFNKFKSSKLIWNTLLAILVVLNPISIGQIRTFYIDVLVYYLFANIILTIILKEKDIIGNKMFLMLLLSQTTMLCSLKLGGIFYSIILILSYFIYLLIFKKYNSLKHFGFVIFTIISLFIVSNINPYFTNIKQGLHPFYPLAGKDKLDIITFNAPKSFEHKNSLYKLFISTFSSTQNIMNNSTKSPRLKTPFSLISQEGRYGTDMRIGGFGYFWSGILLLLIPFVILQKNNTKEDTKLYYFTIITLWASIFLNPESWWARYVPQFWLIPIFIIFWKSLNKNPNNNYKTFSLILIALLFANSLILEFQNLKMSIGFSYTRHRFFKNTKNSHIDIYISPDLQENTFYYKLYKNNTIVNKISREEYLKSKENFKTIPCLLLLEHTSIGAYKINE